MIILCKNVTVCIRFTLKNRHKKVYNLINSYPNIDWTKKRNTIFEEKHRNLNRLKENNFDWPIAIFYSYSMYNTKKTSNVNWSNYLINIYFIPKPDVRLIVFVMLVQIGQWVQIFKIIVCMGLWKLFVF